MLADIKWLYVTVIGTKVKHETRTMHLFAGHGGGLLADLILGHKPVVAVEWDGYACQVLRERAADGWFPGLRVWEGDVRLFDPSEYAGSVDCIHAGFPCQDISTAGKQAGVHEGTRSGLYREVLRIAGVVRPKQLFLENVSAILSNGLGTVLGDLAALGYDTRWLCIRASDVGAPHHRDRWFLLATHSNSSNGSAEQKIKHEWPKELGGSSAREMESLLADTDSEYGQRRAEPQQPKRDGGKAWIEHSGSSANVADTTGTGLEGQQWSQLEGSGNGFADQGKDVADTDSAQRQGNRREKPDGEKNNSVGGFSWWEAESDVG